MRVLFVENHAVFASVAQREFLQGHQVEVVSSVREASQRLSAATFDAVLVDYDLDDGKGTEVVAAVRHTQPSALVVAVSAREEGNAALMAGGASRVCSKTSFAQIRGMLQEHDEFLRHGEG